MLPSVLGLELSRAAALLEAAGARVETVEVRSRKGVEGDSARVIRQRQRGEVVELCYAVFKTNADEG